MTTKPISRSARYYLRNEEYQSAVNQIEKAIEHYKPEKVDGRHAVRPRISDACIGQC